MACNEFCRCDEWGWENKFKKQNNKNYEMEENEFTDKEEENYNVSDDDGNDLRFHYECFFMYMHPIWLCNMHYN